MSDDNQKAEVNERGNTVIRGFIGDCERYLFDFELCKPSDGWLQFDTDQDAWYFGVWVHPERREIVTYAEGDVERVQCPDVNSYTAEIRYMCSFYGTTPEFIAIDPEKGTRTEYYQDRNKFLPDTPGLE